MELKKGYKLTEVGVIPEDWKISTIGEQSTIFGRIGFRGYTVNDIVEEGNGAITLSPSNIQNGELTLKKVTYISWLKYYESPEIKIYNGDILLVKTGSTFGKTTFVHGLTEKATLNPQIVVLKNTRCLAQYLGYVMKAPIVQNQINAFIVGGAIPTLSQEQVKKFVFLLPSRQEQIAIAKALSDVDAYITSLEKLIEKKRQIKEGAMQELLKPKDGWELTSLGNIVKINKGHLITDSTRIDGDIPVIAGGKKPAYFHNKPNRNQDTITISGSGASAGYVSFHDYPIFASDCSTIEENNKISIHFIYYFLQSNQEKIYKMQTGGAQPHIHPSDLKPMQIAIPNKDMQISIANILIEMDKEVSLLEFKLNKGNRIKQGMMQNLLTGKIRLI